MTLAKFALYLTAEKYICKYFIPLKQFCDLDNNVSSVLQIVLLRTLNESHGVEWKMRTETQKNIEMTTCSAINETESYFHDCNSDEQKFKAGVLSNKAKSFCISTGQDNGPALWAKHRLMNHP